MHPFPGTWMGKIQSLGMQSLTFNGKRHLLRRIFRITYQRIAQIFQMNPDLVRPASPKLTAYQGKTPETLQHLVLGNGFPAAFLHHGHLFPVFLIPVNPGRNNPPVRLNIASDYRQVSSFCGFIVNLPG